MPQSPSLIKAKAWQKKECMYPRHSHQEAEHFLSPKRHQGAGTNEKEVMRQPVSYQNKVTPAVLLHHVPPVDVLYSRGVCVRCRGFRWRSADPLGGDGRGLAVGGGDGHVVRATPDLAYEADHAAEGAELGLFVEALHAVFDDAADGRGRDREGAADEQRPDEGAVEAFGARGDELHGVCEVGDQVDVGLVVAVVARDERAKVDACGDAVKCCHYFRELTWADGAGVGVDGCQVVVVALGGVELLREQRDVGADCDVVDFVLQAQCIEAGDLGEKVHDSVFAAHELTQS